MPILIPFKIIDKMNYHRRSEDWLLLSPVGRTRRFLIDLVENLSLFMYILLNKFLSLYFLLNPDFPDFSTFDFSSLFNGSIVILFKTSSIVCSREFSNLSVFCGYSPSFSPDPSSNLGVDILSFPSPLPFFDLIEDRIQSLFPITLSKALSVSPLISFSTYFRTD